MIHAILLEAVFRGEFGFYHTIAGLWDVSHHHHWLHRDHPSGTTECTVYDGSLIKQYPEHSYTQLGRLYPGLWCSSSEFFALAWASGVIAVIVSRPNCGPEVSFFESSNLRLKHSSWRRAQTYCNVHYPQCTATACCGICYKVYLLVSLESLESKEISRVSRKGRQVNSILNIVSLPVGMALTETTGPFVDAGSHGDHPL